MERRWHYLTVVLCVALVGVARLAWADGTTEYIYQVLFDTDNNAATGCDVAVDDTTVGTTTFPGVERLVRVTVSRTGTGDTITGITVQSCVSGTFGAAQPVSPGGWPVGTGDGVGGGDVIEGFVPGAALANGGLARVAFTASRVGPDSDVMLSTTGEPGGAPILFALAFHVPAPLLSTTALALSVLLLGGVAWWALGRRLSPPQAFLLALAVTAGVAATAYALTITLDGQVADWGALPPAATDPTGDSTNGDPAEDLVAGFLTANDTTVYFRMDVSTPNPCEGKSNGMTCDAGTDSPPAKTCEAATCNTCMPQTSPSPRFVDNGDGTITDRQTCLVWEKKDDAGGLHDKDNRYSWCLDADSDFTCDNAGNPPDGGAFTVFIAGLNGASFAGHGDWRLPSEDGKDPPYTGPKELESILAAPYPCSVGPPCVDAAFNTSCTAGCSATGATPCSCTQSKYWSATPYASDPNYAWLVDFGGGRVGFNTKTYSYYVRAVRGGL